MTSHKQIIVFGRPIASFDDALKAIFEEAKREFGIRDTSELSFDQKREVVQFVVESGGLSLRNTANELSRFLKISRTSVYSMINSVFAGKE
jgi:predicted transcriptional regulator YheO